MSHPHRSPSPGILVGAVPRIATVTFLFVVGIATLIGTVVLWPSGDSPTAPSTTSSYAAPGVTFPRATVTATLAPCPIDPGAAGSATPGAAGSPVPAQAGPGSTPATRTCGTITATVLEGAGAGQSVTIDAPTEVLRAGVHEGDRIVLLRLPDEAATASGAVLDSPYSYAGVERATPLWILGVVFAVAVIAVARLRGLAALIGLGIGGLVMIGFIAPSILQGHSALAVAVVGSLLIMYVVLYLTHGLSLRTSTALVGTIVGVALMAGVGELAVGATRLTGVSDDDGGTLQALAGSVSLQGLVTCGIIIGGLGALNDVTITQTSAVWELSAAGSHLGRRQLFSSAMRIGRDHLASTVYTIVFAYVGGAMPVLLLLSLYSRPWGDVITSEDIATELVRTMCSSFGLILAIPVTTLIAVLVATSGRGIPRHAGTASPTHTP